jgi:hypothetical protein
MGWGNWQVNESRLGENIRFSLPIQECKQFN